MRLRIINFLKRHSGLLIFLRGVVRFFLRITYLFPLRKKTAIFASFGGRKFDDSPRAIYEELCTREEFKDWKFIWAFVEPDKFTLPRGQKVKIDSFRFFVKLFTSRVWVSNSGMDRGLELRNPRIVRIETWHGTPLKKICGEEHTNAVQKKPSGKKDAKAIRCAQSEYDREILSRVLHATKESFLLCDLPRNDSLLRYTHKDRLAVRRKLGIADDRRIIFYMPTYREYLVNEKKEHYLAPPIELGRWQAQLGGEYVLLVRAHYAVSTALDLQENDFVRDVSDYEHLNDLYAVADILISDYSSAFIDGAICGMPMLCFAYDLEEYCEKRGLYLELAQTLPCEICRNEDEVLAQIAGMDVQAAREKTAAFARKFVPHAGHATETVVAEMKRRLGL